MSNNISAASQYANRPADERFSTIGELIDNAKHDRLYSVASIRNLKDLRAVDVQETIPARDSESQPTTRNVVMLQSPKGNARLTHWSFGQLARTIGAPASYLRTLPADITAAAVNYGISQTPPSTDVNLLLKSNGSTPIVRACTSDTYGRVWDVDLYSQLRDTIMRQGDSSGGQWLDGLPTWEGPRAGWYRGDRDSFGMVVDGGSIVTDPSAQGGNGQMFRGIILRNSEVGAASISLMTFLFRFLCGNHIIWGFNAASNFKRRHVGANAMRDVTREINRIAYSWTNSSAARDEAIIKSLIDHEVAQTRDGVIDELRKVGFSKEQAIAAYAACERNENASPRSFWGLAQGATRISQTDSEGHQDERLTIDQLAADLLALGVKRHAMATRA